MCEAEFAQIALEIEDFASLLRALGGLGVGILNAADDLAGGGAAIAQGARQASHKEVRLYRAVEPDELDNIFARRRLRSGRGEEVKHFTLSAKEAAAWARKMYSETGKPYRIVYIDIPRQFVDFRPDLPEVLPPISHAVVRVEFLMNVRPRVLPYTPLPWRWMGRTQR